MPIVKSTTKFKYFVGITTVVVAGSVSAHAQAVLDPSSWLALAPERDKQRQEDLKKVGSTREYKPMQLGLWLIDSSVNTGAVFDSNFYSAASNAKSANGLLLAPSIVGRFTDGAQNATFYLDGSLRHFNDSDSTTLFNGRFGLGNSLEISRGTVWKALVQLGRSQDDLGSYNATGTGSDASGIYVKPINSNNLFAATSILSRLDYSGFSGFWSGGVSANISRYEDAELSDGTKLTQEARNADIYSAIARLGINVTPVVYAFVEPSVSFQQAPDVSNADSTNYRITGGIGTDRISLFRGEAFAGHARQSFNDLSTEAQDGFVFGGRLSWFPTRDVTFNLIGDDMLGISTINSSGSLQSYTTRTRTITSEVNYQFDRRVTLAARASYSSVDFGTLNRTDDVRRIGADLTYMVSGNFGLRLAYSNVNVDSSNALNNLERNIISIGLNFRI